MKKLLAKIRKILKDRRTRQLLTRIVSITAAIVVFITTYALVLPAITMESEANCGIPAHQHDDSCYEDRLICDQVESPGHQHTDACYSISKSLICTETEHQHGDSCFDADGNLTCELAEHTHDDSCYEDVRELVCSIPESEGHEHTDDCYERVLACGMEAHTHSTACYSHGSELTASAPSDFAAVATTELGSYGATVSASAETEANSEETSNRWASNESATGGISSTAAAATDAAAAADYSSTATAAGTASTGFDAVTTEDAFVPQLEPIFFEQLLTKDTGIYYYHAEEGEEVPENSADIADWKRVNDDTELAPTDLLRVYLRYTIPAGALNATNDIARYRLPSNLHLTDQQMKAINTTVNGIANQYVNLDTLEITDTERYNTYLGIEATEGTRKPSDNIDEYFTNHPDLEGQEYINAVVRAENVFDETTEEYLGQDLVFTFTPYTVQKNQHEYDAEGQPTKAGQKVNGWLCFDLHMDQIDWSEPVISTIEDPAAPAQDVSVENTEDTESSDTTEATEKTASDTDEDASPSSPNPDSLNTNTITEKKECSAEIVFAAKDKALKIDEISTELHLVELNTIEKENDSAQDEADQSADDSTDNANSGMTDGQDDTADDSDPESEAAKSESADESATDAENQLASAMEINAETYPAVSFEDTITVQAGTLSTDNENAAKDTPAETAITVSVIAEEETFPLGTTMQLGTVEDMDTVASAVEGAVEGQTRGFHAVDISFHNADGEEIEPLKPIKVSITSDAIKQAVEDSSTAPVVVHVENSTDSHHTDPSDRAGESKETSTDYSSSEVPETDESASLDATMSAQAGENTDNIEEPGHADTTLKSPVATLIETTETSSEENIANNKETPDTLSFDAGFFSVYAIVYTVDFQYEVNGKMYEFSIPGGGFASFYKIVEVLGIARIGENTADSGENESVEAENTPESDAYNVGEETDVDENDENTGSNYKKNTNLNNIEVSESAKQFVADVESVEFSSPELVWVGKVEETSTVGGLKEDNGLEVQYSAELTEEQIAEINSSTVEAGDWALISVQPFTSEETLTVIMKNGDQFVVKVTDAREAGVNSANELNGKSFALVGYNNALLTAESNGDGGLKARSVDPSDMTSDVPQWKFERDSSGKYKISCNGQYLNITPTNEYEGTVSVSSTEQLLNVSVSNNKIRITNDWGYAVNLYGWDIDNGYGAWRGNPGANEYFTTYAFPAEIDPNKGYLICVKRNDKYYVLKNDLSTAMVTNENDLNKLSKNHIWKFEKSGDNYIIHTFGLDDPSTMRIYNGQWAVDSESHHTNYLAVDTSGNDVIISGYGNPQSTIVFNDQSNRFEISSSNTTDLTLKEYGRYFFTVSSNNMMYGTVGGTKSDGVTKVSYVSSYEAITKAKNQDGKFTNNNSIQAYPANGYYFDHWELDGEPLNKEQYPQNLLDNAVPIPGAGSELKAIFKKTQPPASTDYPAHETPGYEVLSWLGEALSSKPIEGADKTAEVYDYENRIYRVDLTGHSGVKVIANNVDLAFVTDISNSMLFPESLSAIKDSGDVDVSVISQNGTSLHDQLEALVEDNLLEHRGIDSPYITIGDRSKSSTQYALFYSEGETLNDHYFEKGWWALDASYYARWMANVITYSSQSSRFFRLSGKYNLHNNDDAGYEYIIYEPNMMWEDTFIDSDYLYAHDPDSKIGANRLYYLVGSVKMALGYLQDLANNYPLGAVYTGLETFAGSTSAVDQEIIDGTVGASSTWADRHQDFVQIGGATAYNNADYDDNKNAIIGKLTNITTADGTAQDIAIQQMKNILHWPTTISSAKKYVVMISDGAPNRRKMQNKKKIEVPVSEVASGVNGQKTSGGSLDGAKLITVGLGINDVPGGQQLLYSTADDGLYYNAQDGNDLTLILLDVIRSIMESAVVTSDVHDEIDPTFYPIDRTTGLPVQLNGQGEAYIDLDGNVLSRKPTNGKYGTITYQNNKWQVDWSNQTFKPEDKGGWKGTVYVKAKEDFMGGIGMETNLGKATMTPSKYYVADNDGNPTGNGQNIPAPRDEWEEDKRTSIPLDSPRVNVDELMLTEESSEWTVYLGTSVSPQEQLKAFYNDIKVQEVVTETKELGHKLNNGSTVYTITENSVADNTNPISGRTPETFALSSLPGLNADSINWDKLISDGKLDDIEYSYEGHIAGSFSIELIRKMEGIPEGTNDIDDDTGMPPSHNTNNVGEGVEEYTLRITYIPNSNNLDETYHTGSNGTGSAGGLTDDSKSENTHVINVFAKKLEIEKVDQGGNKITSDPATFVMYRKASADELTDTSVTKTDLIGLTGKFVEVQTLITSGGSVTTDVLPVLADGEPYYLVETKAPAGYIMLTEPLKVTIDTTGHNTWTKLADNSTLQEKPNPYVASNWLQEATIKLWKLDNTPYDPSYTSSYDHANDTTDASATYKIINNAGYELPSTGGLGTNMIYIFGIMLTGLAGCGLVIKRRRLKAA